MHVREEIVTFMETNITDLKTPLYLRAFKIFDMFQLPNYEDKYMDFIFNIDAVDPGVVEVMFNGMIVNDLTAIVAAHGIVLTTPSETHVHQLVDLLEGILRLTNLEDYSTINRILTTDETALIKVMRILETYTPLEMGTMVTIISDVDERFIYLLEVLSEEPEESLDEIINGDKDNLITRVFISYIRETDCLGLSLYKEGYDKHLPLVDLLNLLPYSMIDTLEERGKKGNAHLAIDVLSLLMISSDTREDPIKSFGEFSEMLISNPTTITEVASLIEYMYKDFMFYYKGLTKDIEEMTK